MVIDVIYSRRGVHMSELYSHPGKLLKDHLLNVYRLGMKKFDSKKLHFHNLDQVRCMTEIALITHDLGKANKYFQRKLELETEGKTDNDEYLKLTQSGRNLSNHSLLSALFTYYIAKESGLDDLQALITLFIVYKHHGDLLDFKTTVDLKVKDWRLLEKQFETLDLIKLQDILDVINLPIDIKKLSFEDLKDRLSGRKFRKMFRKLRRKSLEDEEIYLLVNYIFSILISSDKAEAIFYNKGLNYQQLEELVLDRKMISSDSVEEFKKLKGWDKPTTEMDRKRNEIYDEVVSNVKKIDLAQNRILSINVPTGTGKTLSSLAVGLKLRERLGQDYRIIYTLPFTSIIDQNYDVFSEVFTDNGVEVDSSLMIKHHYLTPKNYIKEDDYEDLDYDISSHLIESWNSEIIVTTFVQLLHSIFTNKNSSLKKFHNISNSIILLDEVQSIPHKYWELIRVMLEKVSSIMNCYFVFITATMPLIYNEKAGEINELAVNKKDYFEFFDRIRLDLSIFREELTLEQFKDFISDEIYEYPDKNMLIVLNTIKSSIEVYQFLDNLIDETHEEVIYLSTNIIPKDRRDRIKQIGDSDRRQIIVSTQMVEAGVDIDLDRVYRDLAPLDSINQTCGRCNRNFDPEKKGTVILFKLVNENHGDTPFANYVYDNNVLHKTEKLLAKLPDLVEEKDFFCLNNKYFEEIDKLKSDDISLELLKKIRKLKYTQAFWGSREKDNKKAEDAIFQLIEQSFDTVNLFIELDQDAETVWEEYQLINEMEISSLEDYSKRQSAFEKIKKDFLDYVITIPRKVAEEHLESNQIDQIFNLIGINQYSQVYDQHTGFKRKQADINLFF